MHLVWIALIAMFGIKSNQGITIILEYPSNDFPGLFSVYSSYYLADCVLFCFAKKNGILRKPLSEVTGSTSVEKVLLYLCENMGRI